MDAIVNLILQDSDTLDAPSLVRLVVMVMALEMFAVISAFLGGLRK